MSGHDDTSVPDFSGLRDAIDMGPVPVFQPAEVSSKPAWLSWEHLQIYRGPPQTFEHEVPFNFRPERFLIWELFGEVDVLDVYALTDKGERIEMVEARGPMTARAFEKGVDLKFKGYLFKGYRVAVALQTFQNHAASLKLGFQGSEFS